MKLLQALSFALTTCYCLISCTPQELRVKTVFQQSETSALLQAISMVDDNIAWVSGHDATFARTLNGGDTWEVYTYDQADSLQFRDIHAFNTKEVVLMSAGTGSLSRILLFSTETGFKEVFVMPHEQGFLNTIEFWDQQNGLAFGDSFNGELYAMRTENGGKSWNRIDPTTMPPAGKGEGGFAASGTCISVRPGGKAWIGTGAGGNARVLYTQDYGQTWASYEVPIVKGDAAGIESIHMADDLTGLIVGGDLARPNVYTDNVAVTTDGGKSWDLTTSHPVLKGALYGSDIIAVGDLFFIIACGPNGIDYSTNMGESFTSLDTLNYWAMDINSNGIGYATGTDGKILKILLD